MKDYEIFSDLKSPKNSRIIVRLDGRNFHGLANSLNLNKPYDEEFINLMAQVCYDLFKEFSPQFIYSFSDEISILLKNIPFNRRIEKINSVIASFTASSFTLHLNKELYKPVAFDSRVIPINDQDILSYFKWRQDESWKNCINSYGISFLKSKYGVKLANEKINGLKASDIHDLLFKNGINLNDIEDYKKKGIAIYRKLKKIEGFNKETLEKQISHRSYVYKDFNIPLFTEKFFKELNII